LRALITRTTILPAAIRYQTELASNVTAMKSAGVDANTDALKSLTGTITELRTSLEHLDKVLGHTDDEDVHVHAKYMRDSVLPAMNAVRKAGDALENVIPDDLWPLPTYREMLFIK